MAPERPFIKRTSTSRGVVVSVLGRCARYAGDRVIDWVWCVIKPMVDAADSATLERLFFFNANKQSTRIDYANRQLCQKRDYADSARNAKDMGIKTIKFDKIGGERKRKKFVVPG